MAEWTDIKTKEVKGGKEDRGEVIVLAVAIFVILCLSRVMYS